jgi:hypothetical protein
MNVHHSVTFVGYCKLKDLEYSRQGIEYRFITSQAFTRAFNGFMSVKPQDYPARTRCEICGDAPDILTCDGQVMSLQNRRAPLLNRMMEEV